jgi:hypothetical protein
MTTATKTKNGQVAAEAMADVAGKVTQEAKVITDTLLDVTNKAAEETKSVLDAQQKMLQDSFATWQKYNQTYLDFVIGATQQTIKESLALRERVGKIAEGNWKKANELMAAEQTVTLETAEAYWTQAQATSERIVKLFTPVSFK